ncbi:MAG: response regulator [Nitrospirae bacterium]|nr:MAG: response regulator [Nitrospirota bacterium]
MAIMNHPVPEGARAPVGLPAGIESSSAVAILVVDDEPVSRAALALKLERRGYRVLQAGDGREGLTIARCEHPDVIISDWMMPEMDGIAFCDAVKADGALRVIYFILLTVHDQPEQIVEGFNHGADDFIGKTASTPEVIARVRAGLRARAMMRQLERTHQDLADSHELLVQKQEMMEMDLRSASRFVRSLLPKEGQLVPGVHLAWEYLPSLVLGGDLFGAVPWGDDCLGLYILDASGHGASAALRAASLVTFLRADALPQQVGPRETGKIMAALNHLFPLSEAGEYFTVWIGSLHLPTRELCFSTAGHSGSVLVRKDGRMDHLFQPALPVGFGSGTSYPAKRVTLQAGDRVILPSDGLYEVPSPNGERWGLTRFMQTVLDSCDRPLVQSIKEVIVQARCWQEHHRFADDAALVGLEFE